MKNGEEVMLNDKAAGETLGYESTEYPNYTSEEVFGFPVARTVIDIYYKVEHSDEERCVSIEVYTKNRAK